MINLKIFWKTKQVFRLTLVVVSIICLIPTNQTFAQNDVWKAPSIAESYKNPFVGNENATQVGKKLYSQFCAICHGKKGKGEGVAGMALKPRPADFTKDFIQKQSDGAIFWKMTEGKPPMAAYKTTLTEEQRWQLVNYIRSLAK